MFFTVIGIWSIIAIYTTGAARNLELLVEAMKSYSRVKLAGCFRMHMTIAAIVCGFIALCKKLASLVDNADLVSELSGEGA